MTEFDQKQFTSAFPIGLEAHYWNLVRNRMILDRVKRLGGGCVLDVGCGPGIVVDYLRQQGVNCRGVELAPLNVSKHLNEFIRTGMAAQDLPKAERNSTDIIILGDVLEHLPEPAEFLRLLSDAFPNLKAFIIAVPARTELWSNYDIYYGHFRRYDLALARSTIASAGLTTIDAQYLFRLLYLPARLLLAITGRRPTEIKAPARISKVAHKIISYLLLADAFGLPNALPGTSVLITASGRRQPEQSCEEASRPQ
jgi:2-polyprenyl-3-methyl-5-hydroxy-6-metoxy-1,4-benzoquinol methylase